MTIPALTTVLVVTTAAFALKNWRMSRAERLRSEARIAALSAAIDAPPLVSNPDADNLPHDGIEAGAMSQFALEPPQARVYRVAAAMGALLLVGGVLLVLAVGYRTPAIRESGAPLELVSMRHVVDGDSLIVSGLVRNRSASPTPVLNVVVSAIGLDGRLAAQGQSRLDPSVLGPGKETTFRVTVGGVEDLGRYRLGFASGGRPVYHLDRRGDVSKTARAAGAPRN